MCKLRRSGSYHYIKIGIFINLLCKLIIIPKPIKRASERDTKAVSKVPEKMKINHHAMDYEGLAASSAVGMALFESLGLRQLIDQRCKYDPAKRILSPGMVTKILLGPTFNIHNKYPLYMVNKAYTSSPLDLICGSGVECKNLTDYSLARGLDTLFDADLTELFTECSEHAANKLGFKAHVFHIDSTDISFHGLEHHADKEGASVPKHNGHPKDGHTELLQYELQVVTDSTVSSVT